MDPVLIIGGCGALGSHIVFQLLDSGNAADVSVLDIQSTKNRHEEARYFDGSFTKEEFLMKTLEEVKPKVVIHVASPIMISTAMDEIYDEVNVEGSHRLLKALTKTEHYTHTKAVAETIILGANGKEGLKTVVIRPCTLFGEREWTATPRLIENAKKGTLKFQVGNDKNMFDWTYVGNSAHAHILAAKALIRAHNEEVPADMKVEGEPFIITNDEPWPFWDVGRALGAAAGYPTDPKSIKVIPVWLYSALVGTAEQAVWAFSFGKKQSSVSRKMVHFFTMTRTFDISKAKKRLGYAPLVGMQEGVERTAKWYVEEMKKKAAQPAAKPATKPAATSSAAKVDVSTTAPAAVPATATVE